MSHASLNAIEIGRSELLKRVFFASFCAHGRVYFHGGSLEERIFFDHNNTNQILKYSRALR